MGFVDLHVHSTASDGSCPPEAVISLAVQAGLDAIALTDHDTVDGIPARHGDPYSWPVRDPLGPGPWKYAGGFPPDPGRPQPAAALQPGERRHALDPDAAHRLQPRHRDHQGPCGQSHGGGRLRFVSGPGLQALSPVRREILPPQGLSGPGGGGLRPAVRRRFRLPGPPLPVQPGGRRYPHPGNADEGDGYAGPGGVPLLPQPARERQVLAKELGLLPTGGSDFHGANKPDISIGTGRGGLRVSSLLLDDIDRLRAGR